jgi:hypothetical protein
MLGSEPWSLLKLRDLLSSIEKNMDTSKTIEEFKRINEALNQSLSYDSYVFFVKVTLYPVPLQGP